MKEQNRIFEFSVAKEKTEIKNLFQQIIKVLSFSPKEDEGQENLISIRYLLRKQFYIDYCAYIRSSQEGTTITRNSEYLNRRSPGVRGRLCFTLETWGASSGA